MSALVIFRRRRVFVEVVNPDSAHYLRVMEVTGRGSRRDGGVVYVRGLFEDAREHELRTTDVVELPR